MGLWWLEVPDPSHVKALSNFFLIAVAVSWPLAFLLIWFLKRHWGGQYDRLGESSSEEMLDELKREYAPRKRTVIRTQTEYLPFVLECIRENIDSGLEDLQVQSLLERIERHRPDEERRAVFVVEIDGQPREVRLRWTRDASDRIELHVQAPPAVVSALKEHKKRIPKAALH